MKKITLVLAFIAICLTSFGQSEPFIKSLKKLPQGSTILDAAMLFKKDHPEFVPMTNAPVLITVFRNPEDTSKTIKIQAAYFKHDANQTLVQLYYANGQLYQKSVFWYYPKDSVAGVETKYMKATNSFIANPTILSAEGGNVKHQEESQDLGKITSFPIVKRGQEAIDGQTGYRVVYTPDTGIRGYWVHMQVINTLECDLTTKMDFPVAESPNGIYDELESLLLSDQQ